MKGPRRPRGLRRGQPLVALGLLLTAWVSARAVLHEEFEPALPKPAVQAQSVPARPVVTTGLPPQGDAEGRSVPHVRPAPPRPFVEAPGAAPDFERLRLAEEHQLLWASAVAAQPEPAEVADRAPIEQQVGE